MAERFDIVIVGAGMAGASLAAHLGGTSVLLMEAEERPGYHSTGRSAAFWTESYGGPQVQPLTTASGPYLRDHAFLKKRGALTIGRAADRPRLNAFADTFTAQGVTMERLGREEVASRIPALRPEWTDGVLERSCADIDVAALHQHYLALATAKGVQLWSKCRLRTVQRLAGGWLLTCSDGREVRSDLLVDAAGAWADDVALMAGVRPLGIQPFRRTLAQLRVSPEPPEALPLVLDVNERFYFKPDAGRLWLSPHDETTCDPCDAAAEETDVATAIERLEDVVDWRVDRVEHRWAGLRSFAPDRLPVYGFDQQEPRFFWFAGQGGFGIQTAPAAAELGAALLLGRGGGTIDPAPYAPARLG